MKQLTFSDLEYQNMKLYQVEGTAYLKDPHATSNYQNSTADFKINLVAANFEDVLAMARTLAKKVVVVVGRGGSHSSEDDLFGQFTTIRAINLIHTDVLVPVR